MKKFLLSLLLLSLTGCATVSIPNYINDKHPYTREFYASYDEVLAAVTQTLVQLGWKVSKPMNPAIYEQTDLKEEGKEAFLYTEIRQTSFFIGSRYGRMNVFVRPGSDKRYEVELRYLTVTSLPFKAFNNYRQDSLARQIFKKLEEKLK